MNAKKHGMTATIPSRDPLTWRLRCDCKKAWDAPTYEEAEDEWRRHYYAEKDVVVAPMGEKSNRWAP